MHHSVVWWNINVKFERIKLISGWMIQNFMIFVYKKFAFYCQLHFFLLTKQKQKFTNTFFSFFSCVGHIAHCKIAKFLKFAIYIANRKYGFAFVGKSHIAKSQNSWNLRFLSQIARQVLRCDQHRFLVPFSTFSFSTTYVIAGSNHKVKNTR